MAERSILFDLKLDINQLEKNSKEASKRLEELKAKQKQLKETSGTNTVEYAKLSNEIRATSKTLKDNTKAIEITERLNKKNSGSLAEMREALVAGSIAYAGLTKEQRASDKVGGELARKNLELKNSINALQESQGNFTGSVGNYEKASKKLIGTLGSLGLAVGGFKLFRDASKIVVDFDQALADLTAISGKTAEELKPLNEQAKQLGATTAFSATQVTELQIELAKLGFTTEQIGQSAEPLLSFASATGADLASAAALGGSALRAFGLEASEMERVVSVLGVATTKTALDFSKLETGLSTVAPVAASFGFSIEDTTALLGQLANAGFDASSSATATRNILLGMADANGDLAKSLGRPIKSVDDLASGLQELQAQGIDLAEALELTDKRSVAAFSTFLKGSDTLVDLKDSITDVSDELKEMADKRLDSVSGATKLFASAWEGLILGLNEGTGISRILQGVISFLAENLKTIAKVLAVVVSTFASWKITVMATTVLTKAYTTALSAMGGQLSIANIRTLIADKAMKIFSATTKAFPGGLLISLLTLAGSAFVAFRDGASEAEKAQKRLNDAIKDGANIGQTSVQNQIKYTQEFTKSLEDRRKAMILAGESESKINEILSKEKREHIAQQIKLTEREIILMDTRLNKTLEQKNIELNAQKELIESSKKRMENAKAVDRNLLKMAVDRNIQEQKNIENSIKNEQAKTEEAKKQLQARRLDLLDAFTDEQVDTVNAKKELTEKEKAELLKREADLRKLRERAEDIEDARISDEFKRKEKQLQRSFEREMAILQGNESEKIMLRKALETKLNDDLLEIQRKKEEKSLALAKKAIAHIDDLQEKQRSEQLKADADLLMQEFKALEKAHKEQHLLSLQNQDTTQAEEKARLIKFLEDKIALQKAYNKDTLDLEIELAELKKPIKEKELTAEQQKLQQQTTMALSSANQLSGAMFQVVQNRLTKELNAVTDRYDEEAVKLQNQLDQGLISETEYLTAKNNIDDKFRKDSAKIKQEQFKRQKQADLTQSIINTAVAVTQALPNVPLSILAGVMGSLQTGLIASQPIPKFAKGGVFGGKSHSNGGTKGTFEDGTQIEVEKDEAFFVLNRNATKQIGLLDRINRSTGGVPLMQNGGRVQFESGISAINTANQIDARNNSNNDIMNAIRMLPRPIVAVQDINEAQGNLTNIVDFASF